ncbi:GET complex subunit get1 [Purpureocillium takamizusanense]|uniref:GET complex subunit get1 n=1 Tax=Purpureocillium takamizusanense TaxID=2060973 RepID=A0A9Q8QBW7_9HYPO|nr:GET complex subunit get1 [Purpureocillium takamizusanense]UNI16111.1 GET complex subunit get1 [Purpureocillium takamizusanense]
MSTLLFVIFAIELLAHVINAIGAAQINSLLWTLINYLPVSTSKAAAEQRKLQAEYLRVRQELNATSSQDEFAKWAKLRRQHDKLLDKLDAAKKGLEASRSKFDNYLTAVRLLLTKAPQYFLPFWYGKEAMFWLPYGWFPYYAEWIISFPRAPLGSVSAPSWQLACSGFIALVSELVVFVWTALFSRKAAAEGSSTTREKGQQQAKTPKKKVAVPAEQSEKKEL